MTVNISQISISGSFFSNFLKGLLIALFGEKEVCQKVSVLAVHNRND